MKFLSCILVFLAISHAPFGLSAVSVDELCIRDGAQKSIEQLVDEFYSGLSNQVAYEKTRAIAEQLCEIGRVHKSDDILARGLIRLAYIEFFYGRKTNDWSSKLKQSEQLCGLRQSIARAEFLMFRGHILGKWQGNLSEGIGDVNEAILIANRMKADSLTSQAYLRASELLVFQRLFGRARDYAFRGLKIAEYTEKTNAICDALSSVIYSFSAMDREQDSLIYAERLKKLDPDSVMADWVLFQNELRPNFDVTLEKRCKVLSQKRDSKIHAFRFAVLQTQLAEVRRLQRRYEEALKHANQANLTFHRVKDRSRMKQVERLKLLIRLEMGDTHVNVQRLIKIVQNPEEIDRLAFSAKDLATIFEKNGFYKLALEWSKKAAELEDTDETRMSQQAELEAANYWQSELSLRNLSRNDVADNRQKLIFNVLLVFCTIVAIGLVAFGFTWLRIIKSNRDQLEQLIAERTATLEDAQKRATLSDVAKSSFLARINHELRNPLTAILAYCDLLEANQPTHQQENDPGTGEYLSGLRTSSRHMLELVDDVLEVSKIEEGNIYSRPRDFELLAVCSDVRNMLSENAKEKGLVFVCEPVSGCVERLFGDDTILKQIMINLITNSIKFTEQGFVRANVTSSQGIDQKVELTIVVEDSGAGIPLEFQQSIFLPYSQAPHKNSSQGKGLGLSIIRALVDHLDGSIKLSSTVGQGTKVTVCVPFQHSSPSIRGGHNSKTQEIKFRKVLVVDDDEIVRNVVCQQLSQIGLLSNSCSTMPETLDLMNAWQPDLVMLDLRMPNSDGYDILKEIRRQCCFRPVVIAMTGDAIDSVRRNALENGFDGFLSKPFNIEKMTKLFEEVSILGSEIRVT